MRINACSLFYVLHLQVSNLMSAEPTNIVDAIKHWCRFLYNQMESCRQVWIALKEDLIKFAEDLIIQCWNQSVWTGSVLLWQFFPPFYSRISKITQKMIKEKKRSWSEIMNFSYQKSAQKTVVCKRINGSCTRDKLLYITSQQAEYSLLFIKRKCENLSKSHG